MSLRLLSVIGLATFFGLWTLIALSGLVQPQFLPTPSAVAQEFFRLMREPFVGYTLQTHLASSLGRFAMGFGLAVAIGVPLGLAMGWFRTLDAIVTPLFDALQAPVRSPAPRIARRNTIATLMTTGRAAGRSAAPRAAATHRSRSRRCRSRSCRSSRSRC